jgi:hypothetical protein
MLTKEMYNREFKGPGTEAAFGRLKYYGTENRLNK